MSFKVKLFPATGAQKMIYWIMLKLFSVSDVGSVTPVPEQRTCGLKGSSSVAVPRGHFWVVFILSTPRPSIVADSPHINSSDTFNVCHLYACTYNFVCCP